MPLFNEAEALREPLNIEIDLEAHISKAKSKGKKKKNIKSLPVIEEVFVYINISLMYTLVEAAKKREAQTL